MNRKHMPLLVGGLVVLLLAIVLFYLLFSAKGRYAEGFSGLASIQNQLQRLTNRSVFPSDPNVQAMGKQLAVYQEYLDGLRSSMEKGQRAAEPVTRDRFRQLSGNPSVGKSIGVKVNTLPPWMAHVNIHRACLW